MAFNWMAWLADCWTCQVACSYGWFFFVGYYGYDVYCTVRFPLAESLAGAAGWLLHCYTAKQGCSHTLEAVDVLCVHIYRNSQKLLGCFRCWLVFTNFESKSRESESSLVSRVQSLGPRIWCMCSGQFIVQRLCKPGHLALQHLFQRGALIVVGSRQRQVVCNNDA